MKKKLSVIVAMLLVFALALVACASPAPAETPADPPAEEAPAEEDVVDDVEDEADLPEGTEIVEVGDWIIGIITGTVSQGEEEYLAAMNMEERFGSDRIVRATYPDNFGAEMATTIANVQALADAGAQAIVFVQAVPGAITAIQETRANFDEDILFFAGVTHEPPAEIAEHADIAIISDDLSMGRVIVQQAAAMGADTFAHISFPRHLGMENIAARRELLMETAEEYGLEWVELTAPDPSTEGVPAAQMFILENVPRWIDEHGPNTAFFSTNCGMQEPLITQIIEYGGFYPLQCCPSPLHALPAALNISIPEEHQGDMGFLIEALHEAVDSAGANGRISTWPVPINMFLVEVGVLYSIEFLEGRTDGRHDRAVLESIIDDVAASFNAQIELSNWPLDDGTYIDNFYRALAGFVTFE
ncbi:MAG: DUF3798 domain-containing protein [Lachnospiraceae bacterium]|nr:DUF3798 domain-containing protein [Lachnospiraceae bacterium]